MPRFMNTWTGKFEWHDDPRYSRYAILSHVWRAPEKGGEQTYDDVRRIQAAVEAGSKSRDGVSRLVDWPQLPLSDDYPASNNRYNDIPDGVSIMFSSASPLSEKVKGLCEVARSAGIDLVWDDACCIDKSSSAELSEAINSMYEWYRLSDMCYVYLADVPDGDIPQDKDSRFRKSRWHKRGWTLQELIAPERIEFLTQRWTFFGTKLTLALTLADITGVDFDILTGRATVESASVARRLSWAADRETTRVEDRAYSLMGLFGVHMPPVYGEGENAFLRLQEDIIRSLPDQSVFAWGDRCTLRSLAECEFVASGQTAYRHYSDHYPGLLAPSPSYFRGTGAFRPVSLSALASRLRLKSTEDVPPLHSVFTPQGVRMALLCLDLAAIPQVLRAIRTSREADPCDVCLRLGEPDRLGILQCEDDSGSLIALPLHPSSSLVTGGHGSPIGTHILSSDPCLWNHWPYRIVRLSRNALAEALECVSPVPAEVSILRNHRGPPQSKFLQRIESLPELQIWPAGRLSTFFDLAPRSAQSLRALGFAVSPLAVARAGDEIAMETTLVHAGNARASIPEYRQTIRVELTPSHQLREWGWTSDTKCRFSVTSYLAEAHDIASASSHGPSRSPPGTVHASTDVPWHGDERRTAHTLPSDVGHKSLRVSQAAFFVPSSPADRESARLLRVSLERAPSKPHGATQVWLSIEITEQFSRCAAADAPGDTGPEGDGTPGTTTPHTRLAPYVDDGGDPFLPSLPGIERTSYGTVE